MSAYAALNRLAKWRSVFTGWQLGSRAMDDPEAAAVRDHREVTILLRAEVNALTRALVEKGVMTIEEWELRLESEVEQLETDYQRMFPGFESTNDGMRLDAVEAVKTMRRMGFPP